MTDYKSLIEDFGLVKENKKNSEDFFINVIESLRRLSKIERETIVAMIIEWAANNKAADSFNYNFSIQLSALLAFWNEAYDDALGKAMKARQLFTDAGNEACVLLSSAIIGGIYRAIGEIELCMKYLMEAVENLNKYKAFQSFHNMACFNMAEIYAQGGHWDQAISLYNEVLRKESETNVFVMGALPDNGIAGIYLHQKKYKEAVEKYNVALEKSIASGHVQNQARVLTDLGHYYFEVQDYEKALDVQTQALQIRESINLTGGIITNMVCIAEIYRKIGKEIEAAEILEKALKLAETVNVKPKIFQIHELLSELYDARGANEKALGHYKEFHRLKEEVSHEDVEKKIKNQQMVFEAEQTKKENAIIKAQKSEIERKNVELQETIDELTLTKISRRAKAITLFVAIALLITEDAIMHFVVNPYIHDDFLISLGANGLIVLFLKPIEKAIEHTLLNRLVIHRRKVLAVV
jgi:tetratricopeptide (TPR) repeat protein